MDRQLMQRSFMTIAATALLAACAHSGSSTLPAALTPHGTDATQHAPQSVAYPLRAAAGAVRRTHSASTAAKCGTVVTQAFGPLTYAVRGTSITHATVDATGCDVGIFIGANDGENDNGAVIDHVTVRNAGFAGVLVADGVDNVSIDHTSISAVGGDAGGVSAALAIDGATHVQVAHTDVSAYQTYGFLAEAGASFSFDHVGATGPGAVTTGAQAGFAVAGATQLGNSHPNSDNNQGSGATPAFLVPSGGGSAQSWAYFYCGVTDANGNPLTSVGDHPKASKNTNDTTLSATCPGSPVPTPTPTPSPTPSPTPAPQRLYVSNSLNADINVYDLNNVVPGATPIATIHDPNGGHHGEMTIGGGKLYAVNQTQRSISVFDPSTYALITTIIPAQPTGMYSIAYGDGKLYLPGAQNNVNVFDTTNNYAQSSFTDPNLVGAQGVAYGNGKLYVDDDWGRYPNGPPIADEIAVFDTTNGNALVTTVADPHVGNGGFYGATFGGGLLYVINILSNSIYVFDPAQNYAVVGTIPNASAFEMTWAAGKLYVADSGNQRIDIYDTTNNNAFVNSINNVPSVFGIAVF
jgi:hypothetical protein